VKWSKAALTLYTVEVAMLILSTNTMTIKTLAVFQGSFLLCTVNRSSDCVKVMIWLDFISAFD